MVRASKRRGNGRRKRPLKKTNIKGKSGDSMINEEGMEGTDGRSEEEMLVGETARE